MSKGEQLYLAMVIGIFAGFGGWLAYCSWRYDRTQRVAIGAYDDHHAADPALPNR